MIGLKREVFRVSIYVIFCFIGLLLLISIFASLLNPVDFPFFSFVALFFPLLWIINALFLLFFLIKRNRLVFVALLLLLLGNYQVSLIYNVSTKEKTSFPEKGINLITFNTGNADTIDSFKKRKNMFENDLFQTSDIICIQEFTPCNDSGINVLKTFKHNINVDYYGVYSGDSSGLSVYTNFKIIKYGWLKQNWEDTYALWCDLIISDDTIKLINVQLQSIRLEDDELESMTQIRKFINLPSRLASIYSKLKRGFVWREEQVRKLEQLISTSNHPVILCGDFNDPPSSYTYRQLFGLLDDSFLEKGNGFGFTYAGSLPLLRIDYVMIDKGLSVLLYDRINSTYSDHYPVFVKLLIHDKIVH